MSICRRSFLKSTAASGVAACMPALRADVRPVLTVGLMSDTHVTRVRKSVERTRMAMELFKRLGVDVMAHVGDLADWHYPEAYGYYRKALDAVFPPQGNRPALIYAFGDHDALNPAAQKNPREKRVLDRLWSFADMKERLGIDHGYSDMKVIAGYPFLIFPQSLGSISLEDYERTIADACAKFPEGPVFLLEHPPAYQTTYNSCFQDPRRRAVLDKFPRLVHICGHKHASVKNELCIWQGQFTAVQVSCLQKWYGLNVGSRIRGKESWGVCVMEVFPDRLVFRRYDVRDGSEYRPDAPWTVRLPYAQSAQPAYSAAARAATEREAAFPASAKVDVSTDATPFRSVAVRFPTATCPEDVLLYRVEIARKNAAGAWEAFSGMDVFGDFYEIPSARTGTLDCSFSSSLFASGADYRFAVTPVGFFGRMSKPISAEWRAPEKAPTEVVWKCDSPMDLKFGGGAKVVREGDWLSCGPGEFRIGLPPDALRGAKGDEFRFSVEMQTVQENVAHGVAFGVTKAMWSRGLLTPLGDSGFRRYVLAERMESGRRPDWAFKFEGQGNLKVRFRSLLVERIAAAR